MNYVPVRKPYEHVELFEAHGSRHVLYAIKRSTASSLAKRVVDEEPGAPASHIGLQRLIKDVPFSVERRVAVRPEASCLVTSSNDASRASFNPSIVALEWATARYRLSRDAISCPIPGQRVG